jgi:hypothetical protein
MVTGVGTLILVLVLLVLIMVDVLRTPAEAPPASADRRGLDPNLSLAAARTGTGLHALPRDSAARSRPAAPAPAATSARFQADPVESAFARLDEPQPATSDAALRNKFNAMYVNMSRRSQALVERQLRLIEGLEYGEQDQQRLTSLSKLNRIAMRMHRNSQNLLVLAGQEPATGWNQPVTLAHLVEAALAEIEDYERVSFQVQPDIAVRGPAVHDAVHLLVELIDNATSFSAAEMPVHITGRILTSGGALIDITDRGIGMPANEMAYANQQLDNPPAPDIDVPKWMGLLVVALLGARHGIRVRLNPAEFGGISALVWFPDEILTHYSAGVDPGRAAEPRTAAVGPSPLAPVRMSRPDTSATRPEPAWSGRGAQATVQAGSAAARLPSPSLSDAPGAGSQSRTRRLPIFDAVESRRTRGAHEAPGSPPLAASPGPSGPTTASGSSGLPRRPRAVPGAPGAGFQRGPGQGWGAPAEEPDPDGPDEA